MRDSKGRFKSKELLLSLPSTTMALNIIFLIFILLRWLYVGLKFNILEKINALLNYLYYDYSKYECNNFANGESKYYKKTKLNQIK